MNIRMVSITISSLVLLGIVGFFIYVEGIDIEDIDLKYIPHLLPLFCYPPVVSIILSTISRYSTSQVVLTAISLLYGVVVVGTTLGFLSNPVPQNATDLMIAPCLAPLILIPVWLVVGIAEIISIFTKKEPMKTS